MPRSRGALDAEDLERQPRARVHAQRAADGADGQRQLDAADEVARAVVGDAPGGERAVAAVPPCGGEGVGAGLDGAPVVAGGDDHGVDAVHDALVVRGGAVGIELGEARRGDDAVAHLLARVRSRSSGSAPARGS